MPECPCHVFAFRAHHTNLQIEGATGEGGRGVSVWDTFSKVPGKIAGDASPNVADDHYHKYKDDVALMAGLGIKHYR